MVQPSLKSSQSTRVEGSTVTTGCVLEPDLGIVVGTTALGGAPLEAESATSPEAIALMRELTSGVPGQLPDQEIELDLDTGLHTSKLGDENLGNVTKSYPSADEVLPAGMMEITVRPPPQVGDDELTKHVGPHVDGASP